MRYKLCKFCENRARDTPLRGVYIPHFDQISVKISVLGLLYPNRCTDWGEIWHGGGDLGSPPPCQISPPSVQRVAPWGEKAQNRPMSKLNTGALRNAAANDMSQHTMWHQKYILTKVGFK